MSKNGERATATRRRAMATLGSAGLAGLAGCSSVLGQTESLDGTVVQLVANSGAQEAQSDINEALHEAGLPEHISVEILAVSSNMAAQQYSQWLSAGLERPDLFRMDSGWTIPFILREKLVNLSEEMPDLAGRVKENFFDASVATATGNDGDGLYGVPFFSDFGLMLYRKDLVREAGYDPSGWATEPMTWQRFSEIAKDAKEQTGTNYGFTFQAAVFEGLSAATFNEWMASRGGSYFGARENLLTNVGERPVTVNSEPVIDAVRMGRSFIYGPDDEHALDDIAGPLAPQAALQWEATASLAAVTDGEAVMHRNWPYSVLTAGAEDAFGEDLGVMPMPYGVRESEAKFEGMGGSVSALGGWHVSLNPNAKREDAAKQVLRAMSQDSFYLSMMSVMGYVPPKPALLDSQEASDVDVMGRYIDTLKYAGEHAVPRPVTVAWPMQSPRISQQVNSALSQDKTPEQAMEYLDSLLVQIENSIPTGGA